MQDEANLAIAVIERAWMDCTQADKRSTVDDMRYSWRFLTDTHGERAKARALWCDLAGLDPESVRQRALKLPFDVNLAALMEERKPGRPSAVRGRYGVARAKVSAIPDAEIKAARAAGKSARAIAMQYGVDRRAIDRRVIAMGAA